MGRGILLYLLGVPIPIIILLALLQMCIRDSTMIGGSHEAPELAGYLIVVALGLNSPGNIQLALEVLIFRVGGQQCA